MRFTIIKNNNATNSPEVYYDFLPPGGTLGRSINNTLVLKDETHTISRLQAIIHVNDTDTCYIVNKGTVCPLYINGLATERDKKIPVKQGDFISIGSYTILVSHLNLHHTNSAQTITNQQQQQYEQPILLPDNEINTYFNENNNVSDTPSYTAINNNLLQMNNTLLSDENIAQSPHYEEKHQTAINTDALCTKTSQGNTDNRLLTNEKAIVDNLIITERLNPTRQDKHNSHIVHDEAILTTIPVNQAHLLDTSEINDVIASAIEANIRTTDTNTSYSSDYEGENTIMMDKISPANKSISPDTTDNYVPNETEKEIPKEIWDNLLSEFLDAIPTSHASVTPSQPLSQDDNIMAYSENNHNSRDPLSHLETTVDLNALEQKVPDISTFFNQSTTYHETDIFDPTPTTLLTEVSSTTRVPDIAQAQPISATLAQNCNQPIGPTTLSTEQATHIPIDDPLLLFTNDNSNLNRTEDPFDILNNAAPLASINSNTRENTSFGPLSATDPYSFTSPPPSSEIEKVSLLQRMNNSVNIANPTMPLPPLLEPKQSTSQQTSSMLIDQALQSTAIPTEPEHSSIDISAPHYYVNNSQQSIENILQQIPQSNTLYSQIKPQSSNQLSSTQTISRHGQSEQRVPQQPSQQQQPRQQSLQQQPIVNSMANTQPVSVEQPIHHSPYQQQNQVLQANQYSGSHSQQGSSLPISNQADLEQTSSLHTPTLNQSNMADMKTNTQQPYAFPPNAITTTIPNIPSTQSNMGNEKSGSTYSKIKGAVNKRLAINPVKSSVPNVQINTEHVLQDDMLNALLEGIGLSDLNPHPIFDTERMKLLGRLVSVYFQGTIALLQSRNILKDFIINDDDRTMILEEANNPFKLLPTGKTVLMQMFGSPMPGFMEPEHAVMDALTDLQAHQLGMIAGIRAIVAVMLQSFNPDKIEADAKQNEALPAFSLSWRKKAALWDLYVNNYHKIMDKIDDNFSTYFGEAFSLAYKVEVDQYKQAQKNQDN